MRTILYARKSNPDERNVEHQLRVLREAAEHEGREVVDAFKDDGKSAWKLDGQRPGYDALIARATRGDVDLVMVVDLDRLARRNNVGLIELDRANVKIGDVAGRVYGTLELYLKLGVAHDESDVKSKRQLRAEDRRIEAGKPPRGGHRHFGYSRSHEVVPEEAAVLRWVAASWLAGHSMRHLADVLNRAGVRATTGNTWNHQTLRRTLLSPRLAGWRIHRRDGEERRVRLADWPCIFSEAEHAELVGHVSTGASRSANRRAPDRYLLTGLIECGACGHTLNGKQHATNRRRYQCLACGRNGIAAEPVDAAVLHAAITRTFERDRLGEEAAREELADVESHLAEARSKLDEFDAAWADGEIDRERWAKLTGRVRDKIADLEGRERRLRDEVGERENRWVALRRRADAWAEPAERRRVLAAAVARIVLAPNGRAGGRVRLDRLEVHWIDGDVTGIEAPDATRVWEPAVEG